MQPIDARNEGKKSESPLCDRKDELNTGGGGETVTNWDTAGKLIEVKYKGSKEGIMSELWKKILGGTGVLIYRSMREETLVWH